MTWTASPPDSRRHSRDRSRRNSRRWWVVAVVLLLIGAGFLTVGLVGHQNPLAGPAATPQFASPSAAGNTEPTPSVTRSAKPSVVTRSATPSAVVARSVPVSLRIPAIGVAVSLSTLGLNPDGTVQVPTNFQEPGWFRLGPSPGQVGSAVILGHVDSRQGPAVFFRLRSLRAGDKVEVSLANGMVAHFVVTTVAMYPKEQFPARQVYASRGYSALQLVTCGGQFDTNTRSYLSNVVAYTSLVATTPAAAVAGPAG